MIAPLLYHPAFYLLAAALLLAVFPPGRKFERLAPLLPLAGAALGLLAVILLYTTSGQVRAALSAGGVWTYLSVRLELFRIDRLSLLFAAIFAIQAVLGFIYSAHIRERAHQIASLAYPAGAFICVFAGDYLTLFVGWELMSVASVFLIWLNRNPASSRAGYRYLLFHLLGGVLLFSGIALNYADSGSWLIARATGDGELSAGHLLILIAFCVNAAAVPLHAWLTDAYPEATVAGAVFLSAFTTKTAVYILCRVYPGLDILVIAGAVMALWGVCFAVMENNARRILAYHIVSQVGYMLAGIGMGTALTMNGAAGHAFAHILYKGLLFMAAGGLLHALGTADLDRMGGLAKRLPWLLVLYMVGAVSISGLPLFSGFVTKNMTIAGAMADHYGVIALILELAAVGTFLSVGLKLPWFAFMGAGSKMPGKASHVPLKKIPWNMYLAMSLSALLCLLIGLCPDLLYRLLPFGPDGMIGLSESGRPDYTPYSYGHVLQSLLILGFTALGFALTRRILAPKHGRLADFDLLYRLIGRGVADPLGRALAFADDRLSGFWRNPGLRLLMFKARLVNFFDRKVIDGTFDNTARGFRGLGRALSFLQSGNLQAMVGAAALLAAAAVFLALKLGGD